MWRPIADVPAPTNTPVLIGCKGHLPIIAVLGNGGHWGECLSGEYYGSPPPFEPTHWQPLDGPPE